MVSKAGVSKGNHFCRTTALQEADEFRQPTCLSCGFSTDCLFVDATFSSSAKYFILTCNGPGVPYHRLYTTPFTEGTALCFDLLRQMALDI